MKQHHALYNIQLHIKQWICKIRLMYKWTKV